MIPYELLCKFWEVVGADIFMMNNKTILCIVDYYSKFPVVKKVGCYAVDDLLQMAKIFSESEDGFPKKIISDTGMNITSETYRQFCRYIIIQHTIT